MDTLGLILSMALGMAFWVCIFRKAGRSTQDSVLMGLGIAVLLVNLVILGFFIFGEWPIQREVRRLRNPSSSTEQDSHVLYDEGSRLEAKGDVKAALTVAACPGSAAARDSEGSIRRLKAPVGQ